MKKILVALVYAAIIGVLLIIGLTRILRGCSQFMY